MERSDSGNNGEGRRRKTYYTLLLPTAVTLVSGILSLPWVFGQLGWIAATLVMLFFAAITSYTSLLLTTASYCSTPLITATYVPLLNSTFGGLHCICVVIECLGWFGRAIQNITAAATSMVAIKKSNCFHARGRNNACHTNTNPYTIIFGVVQVLLSQIPGFDQNWWLSILASLMLLTYSSIGIGLGLARVAETQEIRGSLAGISITTVSGIHKIWLSFQALGVIASAFSYSHDIINVQEALKSPLPTESKTIMKKAIPIIVGLTTILYMLCGCAGYAALGDGVPTNLLTGFGFYNPYWLLDVANAAIVIHQAWAFQASCRPLFKLIDQKMHGKELCFCCRDLEVPGCNTTTTAATATTYKFEPFQLIWRTVFVILTTVVSMLIMPFQIAITGLLGGFNFWPLTVYFPVEMYIVKKQIPKWSGKWVFLQVISFACLAISIAAIVGSFAGVASDLKGYKPFNNRY